MRETESTTLRKTESNQELVNQVAKLSEAFKVLQEAISKARGTDLGSIKPPTGLPSTGESSNTNKEATRIDNRSEDKKPEPVKSEPVSDPASGIDSLVKAALGVQGQAANALKGMLPNGK